jgi:hypothetical protein
MRKSFIATAVIMTLAVGGLIVLGLGLLGN